VSVPLAGVGVGVAGVGHADHRHALEQLLAPLNLADVIVVTHDAEAALWGAFGAGAGVVVIAGTGSIAYGRAKDGREVRVGGWGREIDDEGGAWWLGKEVLRAVMRAYDGRGPATALVSLVLEATSCKSPPDLVRWVREPERTPRDVAQLALLAEGAAARGDHLAQALIARAGEALGELLIACQQRLCLTGEARRTTLVGGLGRNARGVRQAFLSVVRRTLPHMSVQEARLPAVLGMVLRLWAHLGQPAEEEILDNLETAGRFLPRGWGYE